MLSCVDLLNAFNPKDYMICFERRFLLTLTDLFSQNWNFFQEHLPRPDQILLSNIRLKAEYTLYGRDPPLDGEGKPVFTITNPPEEKRIGYFTRFPECDTICTVVKDIYNKSPCDVCSKLYVPFTPLISLCRMREETLEEYERQIKFLSSIKPATTACVVTKREEGVVKKVD